MLQQIVRIAAVFAVVCCICMTTNYAVGQTKTFPVVPPRLRKLVKPDCSDGQLCHGMHGTVIVVVDVLTDGTVGDTTVKSGDPELADFALKAAKKCRFDPGKLLGEPTSMNFELEYKF